MSIFRRTASITFIWPSVCSRFFFFLFLFIFFLPPFFRCSQSAFADKKMQIAETSTEKQKTKSIECILMYVGMLARQTMKERKHILSALHSGRADCTMSSDVRFIESVARLKIRAAVETHTHTHTSKTKADERMPDTRRKGNDQRKRKRCKFCCAAGEYLRQSIKSKWNLVKKKNAGEWGGRERERGLRKMKTNNFVGRLRLTILWSHLMAIIISIYLTLVSVPNAIQWFCHKRTIFR